MDTDSIDFKSDSLSGDLVEIDDEEYNIPVIKEAPTLESILNEDDASLLSEDELTQLLNFQPAVSYDENVDTSSLGSFNMYRSSRSGSPSIPTISYKYDPGHILRHTTLKAISAQLRSACERINAGFPSVMTVSSIISLGTSHGLVLVFDTMQTLRWCYEGDMDQSSVSALNFNHDCSRLLAGYARGIILMFDVVDGHVLRTMVDVHTPSTAVLHIKFTDIPALAICSDSGGSVFELNFKRTLGIRGVDSKCIFSGSRGEVCVIEPLLLHHLNSHPLNGTVLLAMATLTKLILVTIRPYTRLLMTHTVQSNARSLPLLSWQFVVIQLAENSRIMDPVLAFARDQSVYFYQVNISKESGRLRSTALQKLDLEYSSISCHWLNTRTIAILDTKEQMHLVDVRTKQQLEKLDLSGIGLVYNSSHFKGISTGGNVSKAMALAGERACYNTVQNYGSQIILLGLKSCHIVSIRNWIERLDTLVDKGRFEDALRLGIEFLEEKGKIVLGLRGPHQQRYNLVRDKVVDILLTYIDLVLNGGCTYVPIPDAINTIIDVSVHLQQTNILFERVWDGFEYNGDELSRDTFLRGISIAILDGKLNDIPPAIMQQLVTHLSESYHWKELEICILNINIERLDIQQVLQLSRQHSLHNALISIWNRGMHDYTSPLQELIPKLQNSLKNGLLEYARDIGNKILVYISCCFSGRAYPFGDLDPSLVEQVRSQVFQFLCTQHSVNADEDEHIYPYLRTFLKFDIKEFLNVLAMAFSDHRFSLQFKQRLVDILILIIFQNKSFRAFEVGWLFTFLRRQVLNEMARPVNIDVSLYDKVIELLIQPEEPNSHEERQQAFLDLMIADNFQHFQPDQLLTLARKGEFYKVCSVIHERAGEHSQVLRCYLLDSARKCQVFEYLDKSPCKMELSSYVIENIETLLEINSEKTGIIIGRHYSEMVPNIVSMISQKQLLHFLRGAFMAVQNLDSSLVTRYMQLQCQYCDEGEVLEFVNKYNNLHLENSLMASRENKMDRVTAKLLERQGDYQGAFDVLFKRLQEAIKQGDNVEDPTEELVCLVHRGSAVLQPKNTWLPLLQCLLNLESHELLKRVLSSADLNLATELHLLLQHTSGTLGDFRNLIMGLVDKCAYEMSMLKCVSRVVYTDIHNQLAATILKAQRGIRGPQSCSICRHRFTNKLLVFRCGHGYHSECVQSSDARCIICSSSK